MSRRILRRSQQGVVWLAAGVALVAGAGGGWALAAGSAAVLHACANKRTGALRLAARCNAKYERGVSWNVQGTPGTPGPAGQNGSNGRNGSNGANGLPGSARAFGHVAADGTLTHSLSASVRHSSGTGIYCISAAGIDPSATTLVTVADADRKSVV